MAGGERERKGKRKIDPGRMRDLKRPKLSKAEEKAAAARREGLRVISESTSSFNVCPFDGAKLRSNEKKCPT
jgi:hypothetical protein